MQAHRHIVVCKFKPGTSDQSIDQVKKAVLDFPNQIPGILSYNWHVINQPTNTTNQSPHSSIDESFINTQGYSYLIDSIFVSTDAMLAYDTHPAHQSLVTNLILPIIDQLYVADHLLPQSFDIDEYSKQESQPNVHLMSFITPKPGLDLTPLLSTYQKAANTIDHVVHIDAGVRIATLPGWLVDASQGRTLCFDFLLDQQSAIEGLVKDPRYHELQSVLKFYADLEEETFTIIYDAGQ